MALRGIIDRVSNKMRADIVVMTDEQLETFNSLTKLQQSVVIERLNDPVAADVEIYRRAGGNAKSESAKSNSIHEILRNPKVADFLESFNAPRIINAVMTRDEMMVRLSAMARTDITDIVTFSETDSELLNTETGELVKGQTVWSMKNSDEIAPGALGAISEVTAGRDGLKMKLHDQKAAMKLLADMQGFNAPTKTELTGPGGGPLQVAVELTDIQRKLIDNVVDDEY